MSFDLINRLTDLICNVATAIITVLIFMLLSRWLPSSFAIGSYANQLPFFHTVEFGILASASLGYWINAKIFMTCNYP